MCITTHKLRHNLLTKAHWSRKITTVQCTGRMLRMRCHRYPSAVNTITVMVMVTGTGTGTATATDMATT